MNVLNKMRKLFSHVARVPGWMAPGKFLSDLPWGLAELWYGFPCVSWLSPHRYEMVALVAVVLTQACGEADRKPRWLFFIGKKTFWKPSSSLVFTPCWLEGLFVDSSSYLKTSTVYILWLGRGLPFLSHATESIVVQCTGRDRVDLSGGS